MNIPNLLSMFRLLLVPFFAYQFLIASTIREYYVAAAIILVSGITDLADGYIARKYNQVTKLGKILDPLADKLTQFVTCIVIAIKNPRLWFIPTILFVKEILMAVGGAILYIRKKIEIQNSKWFGKFYTFIFYTFVCTVLVFPNISPMAKNVLSALFVGCLLFTLAMYISVYVSLVRKQKEQKG